MVFGIGEALTIGGALISGLGGKKKADVTSTPSGGFETLPEPVKNAYLNTYLPDVLKNYNKPRTPIPMARAQAPATPFDSQELWNLQQFSDAIGGYFSPKDAPLAETYKPAQAQQQAAPAAAGPQQARDFVRYMMDTAPARDQDYMRRIGSSWLRRGNDDADLQALARAVADAGGSGGAYDVQAVNTAFNRLTGNNIW